MKTLVDYRAESNMKKTLIQELASRVDAYHRCVEASNADWQVKHREIIDELVDMLPSGSGVDCGTKLDLDKSNADKLVFIVDYHHMDGESGMYSGWTRHIVTAKPSFIHGHTLSISGRDRNQIKEYLHDIYSQDLSREIDTVEICVKAGQQIAQSSLEVPAGKGEK